MEIGASFVAGAEPFELVQPGEGTLDNPAHLAQSGAMSDAASGDHRNGVEQGQELGDVVPVATGECDGERGSVTVDDQVVLRARAGPIDGRGSDVVPPFSARTCDPSTEQSSRSSRPARRSLVNRAACRRGQTPASVQSRSRRQAVTPEQPTASAGTSRHATPVRSTYRTPASATRSGTRSRPRVAMAPLGGGRQQRGHPLPQVIRNKISTHAGHPPDQDRRAQDPRLNSF